MCKHLCGMYAHKGPVLNPVLQEELDAAVQKLLILKKQLPAAPAAPKVLYNSMLAATKVPLRDAAE